MISMRLRRLYFLLLYLTGCPRDRRPEMQGLIPLSSKASLNQPEAIVHGQTVQQGSGTGIITICPAVMKKLSDRPF